MVIKKIPAMIEERIFTISCNETEFAISLPIYKQAVWKSGYKIDLLTHISITRNLAALVTEHCLVQIHPMMRKNAEFVTLSKHHTCKKFSFYVTYGKSLKSRR